MKKQNKGITLIALVITIIVLLILAGVTINLTLGENGIFRTAQNAAELTNINSVKEELQIAVFTIQADMIATSEDVTMEKIVAKLKQDQSQYLSEKIESLNNDGTDGKYKGYTFYIKDETFEIIIDGTFMQDNTDEKNTNYLILNGGTYINTNIQEEELLENQEFTIAARVNINQESQSGITNMDILGYHGNGSGFVWEFSGRSSTLGYYVGLTAINVDYTPYYDKWTDIVMTYNNGSVNAYVNGQLVGSCNSVLYPMGTILIGHSYRDQDRTMRGAIQSVKIWKKELSQNEINQVNYDIKNTSIQSDSIIKEINFDSIEEIEAMGTIVGNNYELVKMSK